MLSTPMREVDCLSFVFIDFYVPALTPHLNCIKTALQLSENIPLLVLCRIQTGVISKEGKINTRCLEGGGVSLMYMLYNVGDRTETCGTPACISLGVDIEGIRKPLYTRRSGTGWWVGSEGVIGRNRSWVLSSRELLRGSGKEVMRMFSTHCVF
jgi:hypothetical protein